MANYSRTKLWWMGLLVFIVLANVISFMTLVLAGGPRWWIHINYESSALTWFSSTQLVGIAVASLANAFFSSHSLKTSLGVKNSTRLWVCLSGAFCFLALDERFEFHERLREQFFKAHQIAMHIPGVGAGEVMPVFYALSGLAISILIFKEFRPNRASQITFSLALLSALASVIIDVRPPMHSDLMAVRREQFTEELLESVAQMFFF